jgi:tight adherence protein B
MLTIALVLIFFGVVALVMGLVPVVTSRGGQLAAQSNVSMTEKYDLVLNEDQMKKAQTFMLFGWLIGAVAGAVLSFMLSGQINIVWMIIGAVLGVVIPRMRLNSLIAARKRKFNDQLMDALMIMSSSFRGGLSLIQAIEAVVDEMPDPIRQEFGIVLGENKMGVPLDESLQRLYKRMPSPALQQMVTAILLARETGGNLALIFSRIISSTRERKKVEQNLQTLTVQGKIQAVVMTGLPVAFYLMVSASNPRFFDVMKNSATGQKMLFICLVLWIIGAISIFKISKFKDV